MGETTGIAWCKSTWSPFIGCTEVSPGCDHCYARELDARHKWGGATHWGAGVPRYRTKDWRKPLTWNAAASKTGERWTVFPSLCDPFDNEVPMIWRHDFWQLIRDTPHLTWLLLTKRIGNVEKMWPQPLPNIRIGASIVDQPEANRDITKLLAVPAAKRFVSYEPALGPVDWRNLSVGDHITLDALTGMHTGHSGPVPNGDIDRLLADLPTLPGPYPRGIDWLIVGGESNQGKHKARPFNIEWARRTIKQCRAAGVPVFVKQLGSNPIEPEVFHPAHTQGDLSGAELSQRFWTFKDRAGADPAEWPEDLRVQEVPSS